jgi:2-C-methyl-D-erythritol 2,4-cyclodiphosphate synthase
MIQRTGLGFDAHRFGPGNHVMLGGARIPFSRGVVAHSDGDVILHAVCDALLGAAGLGDIGMHFPDTDRKYRGVSSLVLLEKTMAAVKAAGFSVINIDVTFVGEGPRIAKYRSRMVAGISRTMGLKRNAVNIKATTTERMGYHGRGEGISALAVANISEAGE